jgi:hypothetical protein
MAILVMRKIIKIRNFFSLPLYGLALAASMANVYAGEGDTVRPFVDVSMAYDSNLFRFATDVEAVAAGANPSLAGLSSIPSLTWQRYGAGLDIDWKQGRQQVSARVAANKSLYSKFSDLLDYTGRDLKGEWKWQLGNRWSGLLSASQNRTLAPYTNYLSGVIENNVRTENDQVFQADYWFHPEWRARARLSNSSLSYSATTQKVRDNDFQRAMFGLYRLGQAVESAGVEFTMTDGSFDANANNDFREQGIRLVGIWNYSGKTRYTGRLGYIQRSRDSLTRNDFSGPEWRFEARWQPTGKTQFEAAWFRDLRSNDTNTAGYEIADGVSLTAAWVVAPKTRLIGQGSYEWVDFQGDSRRDKVGNIGITASYEIWSGGSVSASLQHAWRDSSAALNDPDYESNSLFVSANLKF